jgi:hypothetical protein
MSEGLQPRCCQMRSAGRQLDGQRIHYLYRQVSRDRQAFPWGAVLGCIPPSRSPCTSAAFGQLPDPVLPCLGTDDASKAQLYEAGRADARRSTAAAWTRSAHPAPQRQRAHDGGSMSQTAEEPKKPVEIEDGNPWGLHDRDSRNTELSPNVLVTRGGVPTGVECQRLDYP